MKKNFIYALMSAIALTSAVGFTACSSSDEVAQDNTNPTYDGTSVRTDFAFNITKASKGTTRMSAANVQETGSFAFRGISQMYLFPFSEVPAANKSTNTSTADPYTSLVNYNYYLGELTTSDITSSKSKKIYSMTLPVGTNNFLFYGKATRESTASDFQVGRLSSSFYNADGTTASGANSVGNTDNINFNLVTIESDLGTDATNLAAYLTNIARTADWAGTVDIVKNHTGENPDAYTSLADLYMKFTKITSDRCGSAEAVYRTVVDLYKSAKAINDQSSVGAVKTIATAICNTIKSTGTTVRMTVTDSDTNPDNWTFAWVGLDDTTFPLKRKLPMGAAQLAYATDSKTFSYRTEVSTNTTLLSDGVPLSNICYPSEIVYFDNSPLRATNEYKTEGNYASNTDAWDKQYQAPTSGDWMGTEVLSTTRAVAMTNNVNYGVALLETTVKLAQVNLTDNMSGIVNGASNQTTIDGTGMKVTGILIGGQPATVGWNMIPGSSEGFAKVVYDKDVQFTTTLATGTPTETNYTVLLDNYKTGGDQNDVNFALEIKNGDTDFYGAHGMIPANSTFYLVGKFEVANGTGRQVAKVKVGDGSDDWIWRTSSTYRITNESTPRVFMQDYKTVANIVISADALQNAYSTIPDLRSTELLFGLSVDLKWETGLTFNVEL